MGLFLFAESLWIRDFWAPEFGQPHCVLYRAWGDGVDFVAYKKPSRKRYAALFPYTKTLELVCMCMY